MQDTQSPDWRDDVIQDFARSELFERTFQEGMELVEETASYLDGEGRQESKLLSRNAALAYAAESTERTMDRLIPRGDAGEARVFEAMRYSSLGGGKRLRAFFVLASSTLFKVSETSAPSWASSAEVFRPRLSTQ